MYSKQYRRSSVRDALKAVRLDLGPDAVVHATELVTARGWRGVLGFREVQVTASSTPAPVSDERRSPAERRRTDTSEPREGVVARLVASGLDPVLANALAGSLPAHQCRGLSARALQNALADSLTPLVAADDGFCGPQVFVGPPGVGKTTTIAKIAAQRRMGGDEPPGMVAADAFRAGAIEQLRIYSDIIGAKFQVARTPEELDRALKQVSRPVLVDTAGRSARDTAGRDLLRLIGRRPGIRTHLVMAADTNPASARRILGAYAEANPERLVITKLDECESLSSLLTVVRERALPISYLTVGQRVPEDLELATPALLAEAALHHAVPAYERVS